MKKAFKMSQLYSINQSLCLKDLQTSLVGFYFIYEHAPVVITLTSGAIISVTWVFCLTALV